MKDYPSIPRATGHSFAEIPSAYIFDKLDGSNMRSEWNPKRGFYKHGRRTGLLDDSNPALVQVPDLFDALLREPLQKLARDRRWQSMVVFYEFWGARSIGGLHYLDDTPKYLTVFDATVDKKGFLGPKAFREAFEDVVPTARFLGIENFTRGFVDRVRRGEFPGLTFEGVVAKAGTKHDIVRAKAKTQAWIDRVLEVHGAEVGRRIVES